MSNDVITPDIKDDAIKTKGYFIYPNQLFVNVAKTAHANPNLNTDLKAVFDAIESSANGYLSEPDIKGLFADFDTTSTRLGNNVESKNSRLAAVLKSVAELNFGHFEDHQIDLFGDAYEFLISNYAANQFHDQIKKHISSGKISAINARDLEKVVIPVPSPEEQARIVSILDALDTLTASISEGLPKEIALRKQQYAYYRDLLLTFFLPRNTQITFSYHEIHEKYEIHKI